MLTTFCWLDLSFSLLLLLCCPLLENLCTTKLCDVFALVDVNGLLTVAGARLFDGDIDVVKASLEVENALVVVRLAVAAADQPQFPSALKLLTLVCQKLKR